MASRATKVAYAFIHTAIDSHTRLAYSEVLNDERAVTTIGFAERAHAWFAEHGITIEALGAHHHRLPPRRPAWSGKVCEDCWGVASARV